MWPWARDWSVVILIDGLSVRRGWSSFFPSVLFRSVMNATGNFPVFVMLCLFHELGQDLWTIATSFASIRRHCYHVLTTRTGVWKFGSNHRSSIFRASFVSSGMFVDLKAQVYQKIYISHSCQVMFNCGSGWSFISSSFSDRLRLLSSISILRGVKRSKHEAGYSPLSGAQLKSKLRLLALILWCVRRRNPGVSSLGLLVER